MQSRAWLCLVSLLLAAASFAAEPQPSKKAEPAKADPSKPAAKEQPPAQEMERLGYEIVSLNIGNPGAFGFRTPETMRLAIIENLRASEGYWDEFLTDVLVSYLPLWGLIAGVGAAFGLGIVRGIDGGGAAQLVAPIAAVVAGMAALSAFLAEPLAAGPEREAAPSVGKAREQGEAPEAGGTSIDTRRGLG